MGSFPGGVRGTGGGIGGGIGGRYGAGGGTPYFMLDGQCVENPTPAKTIEQLPPELRQVLIDWAHEQDKHRNDGEISAERPAPHVCMTPPSLLHGHSGMRALLSYVAHGGMSVIKSR